jgi:phosphohistidine phosphatase SixA
MAILRLLALVSLTLATACATASAETASSPAFYVMRHLDTPEGERDPDLTTHGQQRAARLAEWFGDARPAAIYVSDFRRTRQTAAPLAARFGLTPIVYDVRDTPGLIARVRAGPLPALVVGHSNTVPDIVEALGGTRPAPLVHADFGDIWTIGRDGATARLRVDER